MDITLDTLDQKRERFHINFSEPIQEHTNSNFEVYAAHNPEHTSLDCMAYIYKHKLPCRYHILDKLQRIDHPNFLNIISWGVGPVEEKNGRFLKVFAQNPGLKPLGNGKDFINLSHDQLKQGLILPFVELLDALHSLKILHRAIQPNNIFIDPSTQKLILGECFSCPEGYLQPTAFEPLERGFCIPEGRGQGLESDDIYALGVTVLSCLLKKHPCEDKDKETITLLKLQQGSYACLTENQTIPPLFQDFLKGTLADHPQERWSLKDIRKWTEGKKKIPLQSLEPYKANRDIKIHKGAAWSGPQACYLFLRNWQESIQFIQKEPFLNWIKFNIHTPQLTRKIEELLQNYTSQKKETEDKDTLDTLFLAQICIVLNPGGPIISRDGAIMPDGFGAAFATCFYNNTSLNSYKNIITFQLISLWTDSLDEYLKKEYSTLRNTFESLSYNFSKNPVGFGPENCLYTVDPYVPCLSPQVKNFFITDGPDLLLTLENIIKDNTGAPSLLDAHITAFILVRIMTISNSLLLHLSSQDTAVQLTTQLQILAMLQKELDIIPLRSLATLFFNHLKKSIKRYHNVQRQKNLQKKAEIAVKDGNLLDLLSAVHNPPLLAKDTEEFAVMCQYYDALERKIDFYHKNMIADKKYGTIIGRQYSTYVSFIISFLTIVGYAIFQLIKV